MTKSGNGGGNVKRIDQALEIPHNHVITRNLKYGIS